MTKEKAYKLAVTSKYNGYQRKLARMVFWQENRSGNGSTWRTSSSNTQNQFLINSKNKIYARFKDNISAANLDEILLRFHF